MLHSERKPCLVAVLRSRAHSAKPLPYPSAGRRTEGAKYSSVFSRCLCRPQPVRRKFASQRDARARMRAVHALVRQFALEECRGSATGRTTGNEALPPTRATHRMHVRQIRQRHRARSRNTCAACGSSMVLPTARSGAWTGKQFWCCFCYRNCQAVQSM